MKWCQPTKNIALITHACKNLGNVDSSLSISLAPTLPPLPPLLAPIVLPFPPSTPRNVNGVGAVVETTAAVLRRRTHNSVAKADFARTAGLRWFPQAKKAKSARDSVAVATTSSTHCVEGNDGAARAEHRSAWVMV